MKEFEVELQVNVKATINDVDYKGTLMPHGNGRHYHVVKKL